MPLQPVSGLPVVDVNLVGSNAPVTHVEIPDPTILIDTTDIPDPSILLTTTDIPNAEDLVRNTDPLCYAQRATLAYTDVVAKNLFTLPLGAVIIGFVINVTTAFNAGTTNVIDIGTAALANRFVDDKAVGTPAAMSLTPSADEAALTASTLIKGIYVPTGDAATAGAATITALYIL